MSSSSTVVKTYLKVYSALIFLLALTVCVAYINLGAYNIVAALIIAVIKAFLVIAFFMHVKDSERLIWIFAGTGFLWTLYMFGGIFGDVLTR